MSKGRRIVYLVKLIYIAFIIMLLSGCSAKGIIDLPMANRGVIDLGEWEFNAKSTIQLNGQWEFYHGRFVDSKDLTEVKPDGYINVPGTWDEFKINGKRLAGEGYATYRLHVDTGLPADTMLGLRIYSFSSAYRLYINDKFIASNGKPAKNAVEEVGEYRPQAVFFSAPGDKFDIVIHVSNFQYAKGGFWYSMSIGSAGSILALHESSRGRELFLIGALLIISLFSFVDFIIRREYKYSLYFACLCINLIIVIDVVGQCVLLGFFPGVSLKIVIFIWYSSTAWLIFFFLLYVHELFRSRFSEIAVKLFLGVVAISQLFYILTSAAIYTRYALISNCVEVTGVLCAIFIIAIGIKMGYKDGWLNIASMSIVLMTYIHDDLYWTNVITNSYGEIMYFGLFLFITLQMIILAKRIKRFSNDKTAAELSALQAQIKPHFLYNSINTFVSISRYDMEQARNLLINFSNYLRRSFDFRDLSQTVPLKNEIELVKAYAEIERARFEERLEINFEVCEDMEAKVPILVLQPILENAVIHGVLPRPEGGCIEVSVKKDRKMLVFCVKDNGVGFDREKKDIILKQEFGSGVGLSNISGRLKKLYGQGLQINSTIDMGTEVTWRIPANKRENR